MTTFEQEVHWTDREGAVTRIYSKGHPTLKEAQTSAKEMAEQLGWKAPRWWQWWRWGDTTMKDLTA